MPNGDILVLGGNNQEEEWDEIKNQLRAVV